MSEVNQSGMMIVFDGLDGAGKGTQIQQIYQRLKAIGKNVIVTREPGGSASAEEVRELLVKGEPGKWDAMTELLLMYASRRAHLRDTVFPALEKGQWVICDRFADASRCYQGIAGELGLERVECLHEMVVGDFQPDLSIIMDVSPEVSLSRALKRGGAEDRFEKKGHEFHGKVREGFQQIAARDPQHYVLINGDQPVEQVTNDICKALEEKLGIVL